MAYRYDKPEDENVFSELEYSTKRASEAERITELYELAWLAKSMEELGYIKRIKLKENDWEAKPTKKEGSNILCDALNKKRIELRERIVTKTRRRITS